MPHRSCAMLVAVAGCVVDPSFDGTSYRCDQSQTCPSGQRCVDGRCTTMSDDDEVAWTPLAPCGGLSNLRDDFDDGLPSWGTGGDDSIRVADGTFTWSVVPAEVDLRVGFESSRLYRVADDAVELELASLAGPGWAGLAVARGDDRIELTATETTIRCDLRRGTSIDRITADRLDADRLRIGFHHGRAWCAAAGGQWRTIGDHPSPFDRFAAIALIAGGDAGQGATVASLASINTDRAAAGYCAPGGLADDYRSLDAWSLAEDRCRFGVTGEAAVVTQDAATFACAADHRHPIDLSTTGTVAFELPGPGGTATRTAAIVDPDRGDEIAIDVTASDVVARACTADACTELATIPRDPAHRWFGFRAAGAELQIVASTDATAWTALHRIAEPPIARSAVLARFGASGTELATATGQHRFDAFVTQP